MDFNVPEHLDNNKLFTTLLTFLDYTVFTNQYLDSKINRNCIMNFRLLPYIPTNEIAFNETIEMKVM